jgi:VanZ family protein
MLRALRRLDPWLPPFLLMGAIYYLSAQPDLNSGLGIVDLIGRKFVHAALYALLWFLWWRVLRTALTEERAAAASFAVAVGYAATDEYHQTFIQGRHGAVEDVAIDAAGAALAVAAWLVLRRRTRRQELAERV